jgi:hypothetical protein
MSKIALTPNASGSGTFTIASPNSDTDRTLTLPDKAGAVVVGAGSVLQVVQGTYATETDSNNSSFTDTGLTASITPSSSSSKVLISVTAPGCGKPNGSNTTAYASYRVVSVIDSTTTEVVIAAPQQGYTATAEADFGVVSINFLHSPSTTSSIEYKLQNRTGGSGTTRFLAEDQSANQPTVTITLMEIAG